MRNAQKEQARLESRQYYKPHFGPEETFERVQQMESEEKRKREFIFKSLRDQLNLEIEDSLHEQREEKEID
jgi:hypothetical protein